MNDALQKQLINDFLVESLEGLDRFDRELLVVESGAGDAETMNVIFRVIHSIKGTAGCIGLARIEAAAHRGEALLSLLRDGRIPVSAELISSLLALSDALRALMRHLETTGQEGPADHAALLIRLDALMEPAPSASAATPVPSPRMTAPSDAANGFGLFGQTRSPMPDPAPPQASDRLPEARPAVEAVPAAHGSPAVAQGEADGSAPRSSISDSAVRIEVVQLDKLMNLVGELVLARNQIIQNVAQPDTTALNAASQRLNQITTELQESVMKTRMQPIGNLWSRFPRIVRDLAHELGKRVSLTMEGQETELDRTIIEAIKDPLTHIVRNAIDHGIETPAVRLAAGKSEEGRLLIRSFHEGGQVNIEFTDDGQGINVTRVREKAVQRGLVTAEQAARLSEREIFNLVFLPGFSTAEHVTNISGRGVGMDVVKTNIEKIGGSIDVQSTRGRGTTLKIKIPLTLAIIPALVVTSGGERFAIPQVSLLELVRLENDDAQRKIEILYDSPVYRLRGQLLPLVHLNSHLKLKAGPAADSVNIVVLQADGRQFGLVVDAINDAEEIVVKPLGKQLKSLTSFAGATIMGDGRVALILDILGVAQNARVISEVRDHGLAAGEKSRESGDRSQTLLLFESGQGRRFALPLSEVARLEELSPDAIEHSGQMEVVQYRGQIMPLIRVDRFVGGANGREGEASEKNLQVVVHSERGRSVGLVVSNISDIVHEVLTVRREAAHDGILGSAVIQDRVTDLLDIENIIRSADPGFYPSGRN